MFDKINQLSPQMRMLLAVVACIIFFIPYSYYFVPQKINEKINDTNGTVIDTQSTHQVQIDESKIDASDSSYVPSQNSLKTSSEDDSEILAEILAEHYRLLIDKKGRIMQVYLINEIKKSEIALLNSQESYRPLEVRYDNKEYMKEANALQNPYSILSVNDKPYVHENIQGHTKIVLDDKPMTLVLSQILDKNNQLSLQKTLTFYADGHYDVTLQGFKGVEPTSLNTTLFVTPGARPIVENDSFVFKGGIVRASDGTISTFKDGDVSEEQKLGQAQLLANVDRYYATVLYIPSNHNEAFNTIVSQDKDSNAILFALFEDNASFSGYIGPKELKKLNGIDPVLHDVVEYGIITFFAKPLFSLLEWLYSLSHNWGWAIILLTVIVRFVLFPLTYKGMMSMQKFKEIAPKMKEIQQTYKDDPQKMQTHMMDLYRKHGANPLGGCLPLILQMPIFFAIYRVLYNAIELKDAPWILWIDDLSVMDPYFVLPVLMGISMFLQQHITPTNFTDPMQEKIFKYLPVIFTIFFITFPSGLVLYWFVSNVFSIIQQYIINKIFESRKKLVEHKEGNHEKN